MDASSSMAFTKQLNSKIPPSSSSSSTVSNTKSKAGSMTIRLCIHTCLVCVILALFALNQRGGQWSQNNGKTNSVGISTTTSSSGPVQSLYLTASSTTDSSSQSRIRTSSTAIVVPSSLPGAVQEGGLSEHAKKVLLAATKKADMTSNKNNQHSSINSIVTLSTGIQHQQQQQQQQQQLLPPLDSLLGASKKESSNVNRRRGRSKASSQNNDPDIIGDVQFLLDFAVVGFGKCGTTTLLQWLQQKNEPASTTNSLVRAPNYEAQYLVNQRPSQLVRKMYQFGLEEQDLRNNHQLAPEEKIFKGFKNPSDIRRPHSRNLLTKYWPQTPLIVTVRHPVEWLVSIYNYFKIEKGRHSANITAADMLNNHRDEEGNTKHFVATAKGEFHAILAEVGKTALAQDSPEWKLLQPWLDPSRASMIQQHRMPNPIFFMEMKQLQSDDNITRAQQFAHDLEQFLGLPANHLPPVPLHVRPNTDRIKKLAISKDHLKLDICLPEYEPVLQEMVRIARSASLWFRQYFIKSPDVTISQPEYLNELLEAWMIDPCEDAQKRAVTLKQNSKKKLIPAT